MEKTKKELLRQSKNFLEEYVGQWKITQEKKDEILGALRELSIWKWFFDSLSKMLWTKVDIKDKESLRKMIEKKWLNFDEMWSDYVKFLWKTTKNIKAKQRLTKKKLKEEIQSLEQKKGEILLKVEEKSEEVDGLSKEVDELRKKMKMFSDFDKIQNFESFWTIWEIWWKKLLKLYWDWKSFIMCDWEIIFSIDGKFEKIEILNDNIAIISDKWDLYVNYERIWNVNNKIRCFEGPDNYTDWKWIYVWSWFIVDLKYGKLCRFPGYIRRLDYIEVLPSWKLSFLCAGLADRRSDGNDGWRRYVCIEWEWSFWPYYDAWERREQDWKIFFGAKDAEHGRKDHDVATVKKDGEKYNNLSVNFSEVSKLLY